MSNNLNRRQFGKLIAAGGMLAAGFPRIGQATDLTATPDSPDAWMSEFESARKNSDWTLGFVTPNDNLAGHATMVHGRFPVALTGTLYRNGPAQHDLAGLRYHHWFDGDGMLQRFSIRPDGVDHVGKFIRTAKWSAEQSAGHRLVETFGTKLPDLVPVTSGDSLNVANTSVLPFHGQLLALWEGGSAVKVDANTLEAGGVKTWRPDLAGMPFSAHPRIDADGTIWNFGVGSGHGLLMLYQVGADGELKRAEAVPVPDVPMIHDFVVTKTKLVFLMPPLVFDPARAEANSFLDTHVWREDLGMRVLVVDKDDFTQRRMYELPAAFLFHLGNAWEDGSGVIRLDYIHADRPDSVFITTREVMRGRYPETQTPRLALVTLDPRSGKATREVLPVEGEFPRIDMRLTGLRHDRVIHATNHVANRFGFSAVAVTQLQTARVDRFDFGRDHIVEEHIYVADGNRPGYILGTSLDLKRRVTQIACFHANAVSDGPIALARLPYPLPLGLHGNFVAA